MQANHSKKIYVRPTIEEQHLLDDKKIACEVETKFQTHMLT